MKLLLCRRQSLCYLLLKRPGHLPILGVERMWTLSRLATKTDAQSEWYINKEWWANKEQEAQNVDAELFNERIRRRRCDGAWKICQGPIKDFKQRIVPRLCIPHTLLFLFHSRGRFTQCCPTFKKPKIGDTPRTLLYGATDKNSQRTELNH